MRISHGPKYVTVYQRMCIRTPQEGVTPGGDDGMKARETPLPAFPLGGGCGSEEVRSGLTNRLGMHGPAGGTLHFRDKWARKQRQGPIGMTSDSADGDES